MPNRWAVALSVIVILAIARPAAGADGGGAQARSALSDCPDCPEMVAVPARTFLVGSSPADSQRDYAAMNALERVLGGRGYLAEEQPQHQVRIGRAFGLGKYLVTRGQYAAFVEATGYSSVGGCTFYHALHYAYHDDGSWRNPGFPQTDQDPVVCVSWQDAQAYTEWLNVKLRENRPSSVGGFYRLPSEAEWEYAARAGTQTARWWGDDIGTNNADCRRCGSLWDDRSTAPVGSFGANRFGLYDVLGNASEWTQDCWHTDYGGAPSDGSAWVAGDCKRRVARGQSWNSEPWTLRSADRIGLGADAKYSSAGFRVAKRLSSLESQKSGYNTLAREEIRTAVWQPWSQP